MMTREEWQRIKGIAADVLAEPEPGRSARLAARCGSDAALRSEVESLLESTTRAAYLYETPTLLIAGAPAALDALSELDESSRIGERVGSYRLLKELGRGGMGTAYLAARADDEFQKEVAIKLIKRGMDTDAILRRFRHERQILADLAHPNIVMLLDGGTTNDGLPYFVMEHVDGIPIDAFCSAKRLSIGDRLRLFQSVCAAVDHAHQRRVVHRDLKPSNILVTPSGVPKLLDFGIAKLLDPGRGFDTGELTLVPGAMTPQFASPEQIRGERLTTSSDIYSLGVLLYVLLAGRHPYRLEGLLPREAERIVCEGTPPRPSTVIDEALSEALGARPGQLRRQLSGDLDGIVLTALDKEPERRYGSAKALADDIQRHLDGLPVAARTPSFISRLAALVRTGSVTPLQAAARGKHGRAFVAASVLLGLVLAATAVGLITRYVWSTGLRGDVRSIAVLPLAISVEDRDLEYLSDGLTEYIINRLSRSPQLKVIARNSVYRYKDRAIDLQQVGRALGVERILTGRVARRGATLVLTAELIDARDGRHLWGEHYERTLSDLQLVQRDLAQRVTTSLRLRLPMDEQQQLNQDHTSSPEAYQSYLKGRYFWNKRTANGFRTSISYFLQAVEQDPSFALAYAGLADSYSLLTEYHAAAATETYEPARMAVDMALAIDPSLAEAHTSLAYVRQFYEWDWSGAEEEFLRSIELNPHYATGLQWYAEYLSAMGRHGEALAAIGRAQEVDPLSLIVNAVEANILYMAGRYDEAIEKCRRVIEMDPNFPEVYEYLKRSYDQKGLYRQAIAARQTRRTILGLDTRATPALRAAASATSPRVYWQKRLEQEIEESKHEGVGAFEFLELSAQAGDTDGALDWLERACTNHDFMMMYVRVAPNLATLRAEPRYQDVVQRGCGM